MMETNKKKHFYFSMWKRGNTGQFWKGTRAQGPSLPGENLRRIFEDP